MSRAAWLGNFAQWGSAIVALVALVISIGTAYFAVLRHTEELRLGVNETPRLSFDNAEEKIVIQKAALDVILVNAGNEPLAITGAAIVVDGERHDRDRCRGVFLDTNLEPFVLKEKEIVLRKLRLRVPQQGQDYVPAIGERTFDGGEFISIDPPKSYAESKDYIVRACLRIFGTGPTTASIYGEDVQIGLIWAPKDGRPSGGSGASQMHVIWRKVGTVFDR